MCKKAASNEITLFGWGTCSYTDSENVSADLFTNNEYNYDTHRTKEVSDKSLYIIQTQIQTLNFRSHLHTHTQPQTPTKTQQYVKELVSGQL